MKAKTKLRKQLIALIETKARINEFMSGEKIMLLGGCKCPPALYPLKTRQDLKKHNKNIRDIVNQMQWAIQRIEALSVPKEDFIND